VATIRQRGSGKWQAIVRRKGQLPTVRSFLARADAERWARQIESEIDRGVFVDRSPAERTTVGELIDRYLQEVTPAKRSAASEKRRLRLLRTEFGPLSAASLKASHVSSYRDKRLSEGTAGATIVKDLNSLSHVLDVAIKDWSLPLSTNPVKMVRKPKQSSGRERRLRPGEEERLLDACRDSRCGPMLEPIVVLAIETGMRLGELLSLEWPRINLEKRVAFLPITKNGEARSVPLSPTAVQTLQRIPRSLRNQRVFWTWTRSDSFENAWRRAVATVPLDDLRFHDLRHEATSRFFERGLSLIEVAAITGHKTLQMLKRYTHLRAEDLAMKLAS